MLGGVEYIENARGERYFYDINAASVYRRDIVEESGVDAVSRLGDFIERELRIRMYAAKRSVPQSRVAEITGVTLN